MLAFLFSMSRKYNTHHPCPSHIGTGFAFLKEMRYDINRLDFDLLEFFFHVVRLKRLFNKFIHRTKCACVRGKVSSETRTTTRDLLQLIESDCLRQWGQGYSESWEVTFQTTVTTLSWRCSYTSCGLR